MSPPPVSVRVASFDEPGLPDTWARLLAASDTRPLSQTLAWQQTWHEVYRPEQPLLLAAARAGETLALAPLYAVDGMVHFLGVGEADRHDFLGAAHDPIVLAALLAAARDLTDDFEGMKFHSVPETSRTGAALAVAAESVGLSCYESGDVAAVHVDLAADPEAVRKAVSGSMRKAENFFRTTGDLRIDWLSTADEVLPLLPEFFAMHCDWWRSKSLVSDYEDPRSRRFLERWVFESARHGWLRVLRLTWNGTTLGTDFNWHYDGTQVGGRWAFAIEHAARSPGKTLFRQATLGSLEAGLTTYDLGLGDQAYKFQLPSQAVNCITWALYPR